MAFTFNPFTGNLDNTPSTKKGNDAYTFLQETSSSFLAFPVVTPLTGDGTTFVFNISGAENIDNPAAIVVTVDGAIQEPVYSYTVSNNVLTFAAAPASGTRIFTLSPNGTKAVGVLTGDSRIFSAYNTVNTLSSNWSNVYSTVQGNSATNWDNSLVTLTTLGLEDAMKSYDAGGLWDVAKGWTAALINNGIFTLLLSDGKVVNLKGTYLTNSTTDYELTNWQNTFTNAQSNSATNWDNTLANRYTHTNFLPLTGGTVTEPTKFNKDVTIFGNLSCTGTQTFANTVFSTTSSLSVVHFGSGPALWVGNNGDGDIASFYDIDQNVEILHVGGNSGTFPNVGVKTPTPNKDLTIKGEVSASNTIWSNNSNSNEWTRVYSTVQTNSSLNWDNALANQYTHTNFLPLTGGTIIANNTNTPSLSVLQLNSGGGAVITNTGDGVGLTVTSTGSGFSLRVEDSSSDNTPFIVDNNGNVGVGLSDAAAISANKLTVVGNISATGTIFGDYVLANPPVTLPFGASTFDPSVNTSIYIASFSDLAPLLVTSSPQRYIVAQARGLIDSVSRMYFNTIGSASSEGSRLTLINITQNLSSLITNNAICGNGTTAGRSQHDIYTLTNPLTAERGDLLAIRWDTANWVTPPRGVRTTFLTILKPF